MTRLLLVADLHLGKGESYSNDRLGEQEAVWKQALALAVERDCDAVLFAGDAVEYRTPSNEVRAAFQRPLLGYPLPVLAVVGNHDLLHPSQPTALNLAGELGGNLLTVSRKPELVPLARCVVATLPWVPLGALVAKRNGGNRQAASEEAGEALVAVAEHLAAQARERHPGVPCFLLGHWATTGWKLPTGLATEQLREPLFPVEELARMEYDACFFGHIHVPGEIAPGVFSVGSPLCLDFGEEKVEHGCWVWEDGEAEFVPLDYRPFVTLDCEPVESGDQVGLRTPSGIDFAGAVVRVRYAATEQQARRIDHAAVQRSLIDAGAHRVWQIIPQVERVSRARVEEMGALTPQAAIDAWIEARGITLAGVAELGREVLRG